MSSLSLRLPNSLHDRVRKLAEQENISINQFISTAVAEKISALMTSDYLAERAKRGSRDRFEAVLAKVPDIEPPEDASIEDPQNKTILRAREGSSASEEGA